MSVAETVTRTRPRPPVWMTNRPGPPPVRIAVVKGGVAAAAVVRSLRWLSLPDRRLTCVCLLALECCCIPHQCDNCVALVTSFRVGGHARR